MDLRDKFLISKKAEKDGVWKTLFGVKFKIARSRNQEYRNCLLEEMKKAGTRKLDDLSEDIVVKATARYLVKNWSGVEVDGIEYPYSPENAEKLFLDKNEQGELIYRELIEEILSVAGNREEYLQKYLEDSVKN